MKKILAVLMILSLGLSTAFAAPRVEIETNLGNIIILLDDKAAPKSTDNFLQYVKEGFYTDTVFHRVIPGFMIQGGGFDVVMQQKKTHDPIVNEAANGLKNKRGTIVMARTNAPHSATAQFFINVADNDFLDFRSANEQGWGYAVFGKVVEGMAVVDKIAAVPTGNPNGHQNVPLQPVLIKTVKVFEN